MAKMDELVNNSMDKTDKTQVLTDIITTMETEMDKETGLADKTINLVVKMVNSVDRMVNLVDRMVNSVVKTVNLAKMANSANNTTKTPLTATTDSETTMDKETVSVVQIHTTTKMEMEAFRTVSTLSTNSAHTTGQAKAWNKMICFSTKTLFPPLMQNKITQIVCTCQLHPLTFHHNNMFIHSITHF